MALNSKPVKPINVLFTKTLFCEYCSVKTLVFPEKVLFLNKEFVALVKRKPYKATKGTLFFINDKLFELRIIIALALDRLFVTKVLLTNTLLLLKETFKT